jgi:hypothetical protein
VICHPEFADIAVEIDSAPNPGSVRKLEFARDADAAPIWIRHGSGDITAPEGVAVIDLRASERAEACQRAARLIVNPLRSVRVFLPPGSRSGWCVNFSRAAVVAVTVMLAAGCSSASTHSVSQPSAAVTHPAATPSPSPAAAPPTAAALASGLKAAGLPVTHLIVYNAVTDPNHLLGRQGGYTSKVAWQDERAIAAGAGKPVPSDRGGTEFGGGIEVFPTVAAAAQRLAYLKSFQPPLGEGYDYQSGTAILRLSNYLTPGQAHVYRAAFAAAEPQH